MPRPAGFLQEMPHSDTLAGFDPPAQAERPMATKRPSGVTKIRSVHRKGVPSALELAVGLLTGKMSVADGWAKSQAVGWRMPVQNLAQIDVLAEAAGISPSRAALTILNAGWMQILAALPDPAQREQFEQAMARAAQERLRTGKIKEIAF